VEEGGWEGRKDVGETLGEQHGPGTCTRHESRRPCGGTLM
jgi:hypothetical protein